MKRTRRHLKNVRTAVEAPLNKGGWFRAEGETEWDLSEGSKDAAHRSKSPLSPPLLRGASTAALTFFRCLLVRFMRMSP